LAGPPSPSSPVAIRPAAAADLPAVAALIRTVTDPLVVPVCTAAQLERWHASTAAERLAELTDSGVQLYVAELDDQIIGVAGLRDHHHVYHLYVAAAFRHRGIARRLWARVLDRAEREGARSMYVNAWPAAVPVYLHFGFVPVGSITLSDGIPRQPMVRMPTLRQP
jgi:GNAT superfamily N-acetyltransferase